VADTQLWQSNSQAARLGANDRTRRQLGFMAGKNLLADGSLLTSGNADEPNYAAVRPAAQHGQLAEVFVQSHEYAALLVGHSKNFFVARIGRPIAGPNDIVPK
jgi:hypothetical protein